jgi:hypothetical protein
MRDPLAGTRLWGSDLLLLLGMLVISDIRLEAQQQGSVPPPPQADMSDDPAEGVGVMRIENEMKIGVPDSLVEKVWAYLMERYIPRPRFLEPPGLVFGAKASDEYFTDVYMDTPELFFLGIKSAVRHRSREIPGDSLNRKDGRQLMQIKLNGLNTGDSTSRGEIKFQIRYYEPSRRHDDSHPVLGIIKRDERPLFAARMAELGVNPLDLRPILTIEQRRRRVYVYDDNGIFLSLTLDNTSTRKWWMREAFTEIELELNEIAYTSAGPQTRKFLEGLNERIREDLVAHFPTLVQNQTPKYNKMYARFTEHHALFPLMMHISLNGPAYMTALCGVALLALVLAAVRAERRRVRERQLAMSYRPVINA